MPDSTGPVSSMNEAPTLAKKYAQERVLVVPRPLIEQSVGRRGVGPITDSLFETLMRATPMRRDLAEDTIEVTQLVAYFVVRSGNEVLTHKRSKKQPEKRLTNVRSLGFSGHMTDDDLQSLMSYDFFHGDGLGSYTNRELAEEVRVNLSSEHPISLRCCIWDPSDTLGQQHIGLVYEVPTDGKFEVLEPGLIVDARFESISSIRSSITSYTSWSQLLLAASEGDDFLKPWRRR